MILALESSCDESAAAIFDPGRGLAGEWTHTQIAIHERHGGVVPALAAREHLSHLPPLIARALAAAGSEPIGEVAVTRGPGLAPCLALGVAAGKALARAKGVPVRGINHLRGHAWSPFIAVHAAEPAAFERGMAALLPHLGLIVSGGHTLLFSIGADRRIAQISSTRDDAAGEALDKGAKLLGLGYPGGPLVEKEAAAGRASAFEFPRGLPERDNLDFSFSGLKTSLRYTIERLAPEEARARRADLCASYQGAVVSALAYKTKAALERRANATLEQGSYRSLGLSGGVAANASLRAALAAEAQRRGIPFMSAASAHTGDNAGMIAFAAWIERDAAGIPSGTGLGIEPSLGLEEF